MNSPATQWNGDGAATQPLHTAGVPTLRATAGLLAQANSLHALQPLTQLLGFAPAERVSRDAQRTLSIDQLVADATIARGPGRLRCLSAVLVAPESLNAVEDTREQTRQLCHAVAQHAPAREWCIVVLDSTATFVTIAIVTRFPTGPRVAALRVDRRRIVDSDADTLRALADVTEADPPLRHARFADILGRHALSTRFYRALDNTVQHLGVSATGSATPAERRELALLCTSRCLFLAFLEAKGWLNRDRQFLLHHVTRQLELGGALHERLLRPLFFGTLNTPVSKRARAARALGEVPFLNGGLFAPTPLERTRRTLRFTDDALVALIGDLLDRYRFTAHEDSTSWSEAAIDPEMLGRAFESLMSADERHRSGTYYTPPALVETVVCDAFRTALPLLPAHALDHTMEPLTLDDQTHAALNNMRLLDPACGSGAFLVHALERLANIRARAGDTRPMHTLRRDVLVQSIFGVDRNPMAVWLCELRLWLSIVIESPETNIAAIPPLPNLDHHIRLGDSLAGGDFAHAPPSARRLTALRDRYTRASGSRKRALADALDREERQRAIMHCQRRSAHLRHERSVAVQQLRAHDLFGERRRPTRQDAERLRTLRRHTKELADHQRRLELGGALPFRFATQFADVAAGGGFPIIIGNPPWVRPHGLPIAERTRLRAEYHSMRHASWRAGAARAGAGAGFAAQADLSTAFIERSVQLLAPNGVIALLVPAKLWRALAGGGIRQWLAAHTRVRAVHDWSDAPALFDAAVYPSLVVAERCAQPYSAGTPVQVSVTRHHVPTRFSIPLSSLAFAGDAAAPWLLFPSRVLHAFEQLRNAGPALGDSPLGRPMLGVKCGLNAAFLVHATEHDDGTATVVANGRQAVIERQVLRPALRGDAVFPRDGAPQPHDGSLRILWTHGVDGAPLRTLPPGVSRWLAHFRPQLEQRKDSRARQPWWTLFRTDAARHEAPRVVWADIAKRLRPRVFPAGDPTVPLNSCYVMRTASLDDAYALHTLLSSPLAAAWFEALAEPARGGFRRYMGWTVATLPVPVDWAAARVPLAALGRRRSSGEPVSEQEHLDVVATAYGVSVAATQPLLAWFAR